jgi:dihydroorotase
MTKIVGRTIEEGKDGIAYIEFDGDTVSSMKWIDPRLADDIVAIHGAEWFDPQRYLILPSFIDLNATLCRPPTEDLATGSMAALNGGVGYVCEVPVMGSDEVASIDVLPYQFINYENLLPARAGGNDAAPYIICVGSGLSRRPFGSLLQAANALARYTARDVAFSIEEPALVEFYRHMAKFGIIRTSDICELAGVEAALTMIEGFGLHGKINTVSSAKTLYTIADAKARGVDVTAEVSLHHLYFDSSMFTAENERFLRVRPGLGDTTNRVGLLDGLKEGIVDYLVSGHYPVSTREKLNGMPGTPQLDTFGSMLAWLNAVPQVPWETLWRTACKNPGEFVGKYGNRKVGRLLPGYEASAVVLDLESTAVDGGPLQSKCGWSPYDLRDLPGIVSRMWVKGVADPIVRTTIVNPP